MRAPVIAITRSSKLPAYEQAASRAGAEIRIVEVGSTPSEIVASVDGLILTGGGDVDPALYGEAAHSTFDPAEPGRDAFEIELIHRAMDADLPMLAICRGMQVLNVARGGSLVQHIPDQIVGAVNHRVSTPPDSIAHDVRIQPGTLLARLVASRLTATGTCAVNSRHHQAPRNVGEGLTVSATAPDGVVEGLEDPHFRFLVAVQWHPENFCRTGEFRELFEGLVRSAQR